MLTLLLYISVNTTIIEHNTNATVSTYISHLHAKLRTIIALQGVVRIWDPMKKYPISQLQKNEAQPPHKQKAETYRSTVIPRLTKIIRSGITFVSRNTHTDGKDMLLEWPDRSFFLLYDSARIH